MTDSKVQHSDDQASDEELEEEDFIPKPSLCSLGFEAMLRSVLPFKKSIPKAGRWDTKLWYIIRADIRHLGESDIPNQGSTLAIIRVNAPRPCIGEIHSNPQYYPTALGPE